MTEQNQNPIQQLSTFNPNVPAQQNDSVILKDVFILTIECTASANPTKHIYTARFPCEIIYASEVHSTGSTGASTLVLVKATGTTILGSGATAILNTPFNLNGADNTVSSREPKDMVLSARKLDPGDRLGFWIDTGANTGLVGCIVTIHLQFTGQGYYRNQ